MNPVGKALWYIETHFAEEVTLDDVAACGGVSRFHLSRAFGVATGRSIMRYVRGRRLTEAARRLADGAPDILSVALDAGYGSHEAFTRAFRDQFGVTPETVREQRRLDNIELVEPHRMDDIATVKLDSPRFENGRPLLIAGLGARYNCENLAGIPGQWQRFAPHIGNLPRQVGTAAYGVCCNVDDTGAIDYVCGVEVSDFDVLPGDFTRLRLPAQRYAVFLHRDHVSTIRSSFSAIFSDWLPHSGHEPADAPDFERYDERFNAVTGRGGVEIWVPIKG